MRPIEILNKTMEEYNAEFEKAKTPKEQEKVNKAFEKKIEAAEKEMEKAFEAEIKSNDEELEKEQAASAKALSDLESADEEKRKPKSDLSYEELKALNMGELKAKAKDLGLKGYSKLNEEDLIKLIQGK